MWTKRGCRKRPCGQAGDNSLEAELSPACPHSPTLCPHCAALAPRPDENACGAITTGFNNFLLSKSVPAWASSALDIRTTDRPLTTQQCPRRSFSTSVTPVRPTSSALTCAQMWVRSREQRWVRFSERRGPFVNAVAIPHATVPTGSVRANNGSVSRYRHW